MRGLALAYLSKMKIAMMVRQLDLRHILWCGRVVRVERAPGVRVVRGVQKMPDLGNGVIGFDHVRLHVRDFVLVQKLLVESKNCSLRYVKHVTR
jgi:hypothetical protein